MAFNRVCAAVPDLRCQSEGDNEEEKPFGNFSADIESVDLPLGNTLRHLWKRTQFNLQTVIIGEVAAKFCRFWKYIDFEYINYYIF